MSIRQLISTLIPPINNLEIQDYYRGTGLVLGGKLPYLDFAWEYPPAGLEILTLIRAVSSDAETFRNLYVLSLFGCWLLLWYLIYRYAVKRLSWPRPWLQLMFTFGAIYCGLSANKTLINPDVWTALLCLGFFLNLRSRPVLASFFLGIAAALRLYPVVWLPLLIGPKLGGVFKPSQWLKLFLGFFVPILLSLSIWKPTVILIPFIKTVIIGQLARGVEVESLSASLMVFGQTISGELLRLYWQPEFRSLNMEWVSMPDWWPLLKLIVWIPLVMAVWELCKWLVVLSSSRRRPSQTWRRPGSMVGSNPNVEVKIKTWDLIPTMDPDFHRDDVKSTANFYRIANLLILGLILKLSVFSPQYLIWLWVPFSLWAIEEAAINKVPMFEIAAMLAIHGLTAWSLWYMLPGNYLILQQFNSLPYWLMMARNLLMVGLFWIVYRTTEVKFSA